METKPRLTLLAMIFCEMVINDLKTGNRSLISSFNRINAPNVPCVYPKFNVFFMVTGGIGNYSFKVDCVSGQNQKIFELDTSVSFEKQEAISELDVEIRGINFPEYGDYKFTLYSDDDILMSRYLTVAPLKEEQKK